MLSSADAIGKIQQIYREGDRQVPYPTFIRIFNDLLADPQEVVPKPPGEELAEKFRAACMAVNVGVYDSEGRGEARIEEFMEEVYPVWKEEIPSEEFAKYEDIVEGEMRGKFGAAKEAQPEAAQPVEGAGEKTSELLKRLGIAPSEEEEEEEAEAVGEAEAPEEELEGLELEVEPSDEEAARADTIVIPEVFDSVDELVSAVQRDRLEIKWHPRSDRKNFATYRLTDYEVDVFLVEGNTRNYVICSVPEERPEVLNVSQQMDAMAAEMGYQKTDEFYYKRREGDFLLRIRIWPDRLDMACGYPKGGDADSLTQQIQKIHRDLGELLERLSE